MERRAEMLRDAEIEMETHQELQREAEEKGIWEEKRGD